MKFRCAGKTGKVVRVKVSHVEGVASHDGLESCGATRKDGVEALTEEHAGWVLSRENMTLLRQQQALQGADALEIAEGKTGCTANARGAWTPRGRRPQACTEPSCAGTGRSHVCL